MAKKDLLTFLNRHKQPFDWENEELHQDDDIDQPLIRAKHLTPANMPEIELERDMVSDTVVVEEETAEQEAADAAKNSQIVDLTDETPGVSSNDDFETPETPGVSSEDLSDTLPSQECVNPTVVKVKEPIKVETVVEDDDDDDTLEPEFLDPLDDDDDMLGSTMFDGGRFDSPDVLPEGTVRSRKPEKVYNANFKNKRYDGVTTEGVINFNMDEEKLRPFTKEDALLHVLGVIMIQTRDWLTLGNKVRILL